MWLYRLAENSAIPGRRNSLMNTALLGLVVSVGTGVVEDASSGPAEAGTSIS